MNRNLLAAGAVTVLLLSSCATVPELSETNRCMLLIDRDFTTYANVESFLEYWIYVDREDNGYLDVHNKGLYNSDLLPDAKMAAADKFFLMDELRPGKHKLDIVVVNTKGSGGGLMLDDAEFVLEDGAVTIFGLALSGGMVQQGSPGKMTYTQQSNLIPMTEQRVNLVIEEFKAKDENMEWAVVKPVSE